jgi:hypothetical protein
LVDDASVGCADEALHSEAFVKPVCPGLELIWAVNRGFWWHGKDSEGFGKSVVVWERRAQSGVGGEGFGEEEGHGSLSGGHDAIDVSIAQVVDVATDEASRVREDLSFVSKGIDVMLCLAREEEGRVTTFGIVYVMQL